VRPFDENGVFCPVAEGEALRHQAIRGAGATVFSQALAFLVQMASTVVLARLLTPSDFGLVTIVTTFSLLLLNWGLNGFTEAVMQREEISHALISNLFWINLGIGVILTASFAVAGHWIALSYHDSRLAPVAAVLSLSILMTSLTVHHLALLKRAMRFVLVAGVDVLGRVVAVAVSISLAIAGWGYWAIVGGIIAQSLTHLVCFWYFCRWLPGMPGRVRGTWEMIWFAICTYGRFTVSYCTWNLDNLVVGWFFGAQILGFYKKAYDLFVLPTNQLSSPLTSVAISALSRLQNNVEEFKRQYLSSLSVLAFLGMGIGADMMLVGKEIIRFVLGPQWAQSGHIFIYFCPGIGMMLLYFTHGWLHISLGRADRWFRWGIVELLVTGSLFLAGLHWKAVGVAVAWVLSFWILIIPGLWYAGRPVNLEVKSFIAPVWRYMVASVIAGVGCDGLLRLLAGGYVPGGTLTSLLRIAYVSALFTVLYCAAVVILHWSFAPFRRIGNLLHHMRPSTSRAYANQAAAAASAEASLASTAAQPAGE